MRTAEASWTRAVALINLDKLIFPKAGDKSLNHLNELNSDKFKVISLLNPNLIIFKKRNCSYEQAGKKIERLLLKICKKVI